MIEVYVLICKPVPLHNTNTPQVRYVQIMHIVINTDAKNTKIYHTQNVQEPQETTSLQEHTHSEPHTTHNIGITLTTR